MELCDRLLDLLGKPESDPDFQQFLHEMKPYLNVERLKHIKGFEFRKLGFSLLQDDNCGGLVSLAFHIHTRAVRDGAFRPYDGLLPSGITTQDSRAEVCSKLGIDPFRSTPLEGYPNKVLGPWEDHPTWWDSYQIPPFRFIFIFSSPKDGMEIMGVGYLPLYLKSAEQQEAILTDLNRPLPANDSENADSKIVRPQRSSRKRASRHRKDKHNG